MGQKVIVDSNVLIALVKADDSTHLVAKRLVLNLHDKGYVFIALNLVIQESATVISMKVGQKAAKDFFENRARVIDQEIYLDSDLEKTAWRIFIEQNKKGTSFIDCANLAVIQKYKLDGILSFDEFYPKSLRMV